jgi:hypothetical protein
MVQATFPRIHLLAQKKNLGFAAANNLAYAQSTGDYVVLLNPDALIENDALYTLCSYMDHNPKCGISGGRIVNMDGSPAPSARSFPGVLNRFLVLSGLSDRYPNSRFLGRPDLSYLDDTEAVLVDWVPGTFSCLRRELIEQIGFFDERFFMYYEETDLCLRAKKQGWKIIYLPWARVWHVGGASSKTRKELVFDPAGSQLLSYRLKSEMLYWRKNFTFLAMIANTGLEFAFHVLRAMKNTLYGQDKKNKKLNSLVVLNNLIIALKETRCGTKSPPTPW